MDLRCGKRPIVIKGVTIDDATSMRAPKALWFPPMRGASRWRGGAAGPAGDCGGGG
jgi:hypothetical protein